VGSSLLDNADSKIIYSVPQHVGLVPLSRKPFQNTTLLSNSTPPLQQNLFSDFDFNLEPLSFTNLLSSPDFVPFELSSQSLIPDPSFPSIGGYFLPWPVYVAAITRVSEPIHRQFASNVLSYIGENMGIRQATNMASFLHAHPAFRGMEIGKGKESGVMGEIKVWEKEMPIQPLREILEREEKEQALIRAAGEKLVRSCGEGEEGQGGPGMAGPSW
jgi:hypothetical protein